MICIEYAPNLPLATTETVKSELIGDRITGWENTSTPTDWATASPNNVLNSASSTAMDTGNWTESNTKRIQWSAMRNGSTMERAQDSHCFKNLSKSDDHEGQ